MSYPALHRILTRLCQPALALSGGVDSATLLWAAREAGCDVRPFFVQTPFQPQSELADAQRLTRSLRLPLTVLHADTLADPLIAANPPDRCYRCKRLIMTTVRAAADRAGCTLLLDGTNASDDAADRPGQRALRELGVRSPLREAGLTKEQVRTLAREAGLFCWNKPAYACLATRTPAGTPLTASELARTEAAETALARLGFADFRVRSRGGAALLQIRRAQFALYEAQKARVEAALSAYPAGYSIEERI